MSIMHAAFFLIFLVPITKANPFYFELETTENGINPRDSARGTGRGQSESRSDCQNISPIMAELRDQFPLDPFYKKYTHAYGIPIISSDVPSDEALTRACYVVRFMLADRLDLRDTMYDAYGRVGVIGETEQTTDIPEHSHLSDYWNTRARGLGGTMSRPISTDGEENLLCRPFDRWWEEDVMVHEFGHAIHLISLRLADATFNGRLKDTYDAAKSNGLWSNTYAIVSYIEYFAEGIQGFFNVQTHRNFVDNVHNNISTRAALMEYDRPLYDLLEEVFPCKNIIVDKCADQSLVAEQVLRKDCNYN